MFENVKKIVLKLFQSIWKSSEYLLEPFCPVVNDSAQIEKLRYEKYHWRYISPFIMASYLIIDNILVHLIVGYNVEEPYIIQHVIIGFMPKEFLPQIDLLFYVGMFFLFTTFLNLIFDKNQHLSQIMFPSREDSSYLRSSIGDKIDKKLNISLKNFWLNYKNKLEILQKIIEIQLSFAFSLPLFIYELYRMFFIPGYKTQFRIWFCLMFIIKHVHEVVVVQFMIGFHFITLNLFLNIKQRHILFSTQIFQKLKSFENFDLILKEILRYTQEINDYNAFYSKYMTIIIFSYCFLGCATLNGAINKPEIVFIVTLPWIFFSFVYLIGIATFAIASSKTIFLNRKISMKLQDFQTSLCDRKITPYRRNIVHLELSNEYKTLLLSTCFRISTKTVLDNKLWLFQITRYLIMIYFKIIHKF